MRRDFGLEEFKASAIGKRVQKIIEDPEQIRDMEAFSRHEIPAVIAIGKALLALHEPELKRDNIKQNIGRWVRQVLAPSGWVPLRPGRVSPGNLFSTGMIYTRRKPLLSGSSLNLDASRN
jgi:hypothetical protein